MNKLLDIVAAGSRYPDPELLSSEIELDSKNKVVKKDKYFGIDATVIYEGIDVEYGKRLVKCNTPIIITDSLELNIENPLFERASLNVYVFYERDIIIENEKPVKRYSCNPPYAPVISTTGCISIRKGYVKNFLYEINYVSGNYQSTCIELFDSRQINSTFRYIIIFVEPEIKTLIKSKEIEDKKNKEIDELKQKLENLYLEFDLKMKQS